MEVRFSLLSYFSLCIVCRDPTTVLKRDRGLVTGLVSAPFIVNNFISAEIAQSVLPDWYVPPSSLSLTPNMIRVPVRIRLERLMEQAMGLHNVRHPHSNLSRTYHHRSHVGSMASQETPTGTISIHLISVCPVRISQLHILAKLILFCQRLVEDNVRSSL